VTPRELTDALLKVIPGRRAEHCCGWTLTAKLVPEREEIRYTASIAYSTDFALPYEALKHAPVAVDALRLQAEDICEADQKLRALADEMSQRAPKDSENGQPERPQEGETTKH
jgi:hypothetical protein